MEPVQEITDAAHEAVHAARDAAQAIEMARQNQIEEAVTRTKDALLQGLKEVFGDSDSKDPQAMKVLVRRIPILCTSIEQMHQDISDLKDTQKWATRIVVGLFIAAVAKMVFLP